MNDLRDELAEFYVQRMSQHGEEPWSFRNRYIYHLLSQEDGTPHPHDPLPGGGSDQSDIHTLLELQRHALMMFTSCGWFFDDPGGLEPVQIMRYAHRAIRLHENWEDAPSKRSSWNELVEMNSPDLQLKSGRSIYDNQVKSIEKLRG